MTPSFSIRTTPRFERLARSLLKAHAEFRAFQDQAREILQSDPYNRSRSHPIKKLEGVRPGGRTVSAPPGTLPVPLRHLGSGGRSQLLWTTPRSLSLICLSAAIELYGRTPRPDPPIAFLYCFATPCRPPARERRHHCQVKPTRSSSRKTCGWRMNADGRLYSEAPARNEQLGVRGAWHTSGW